jgi:hypothetical protein
MDRFIERGNGKEEVWNRSRQKEFVPTGVDSACAGGAYGCHSLFGETVAGMESMIWDAVLVNSHRIIRKHSYVVGIKTQSGSSLHRSACDSWSYTLQNALTRFAPFNIKAQLLVHPTFHKEAKLLISGDN